MARTYLWRRWLLLSLTIAVVMSAAACVATDESAATVQAIPLAADVRLQLREASSTPQPGFEPIRDSAGAVIYLAPTALIDANDVQQISLIQQPGGVPAIDLRFRPEARQRIGRDTQARVGRMLAWTVDGQIESVAHLAGSFSAGMRLSGAGVAQTHSLWARLSGGRSDAAFGRR